MKKQFSQCVFVLLLVFVCSAAYADTIKSPLIVCRNLLPDHGVLKREGFEATEENVFKRIINWGQKVFFKRDGLKPSSSEIPTQPDAEVLNSEINNNTETLLSYISLLLNEQVINLGDLESFRQSISDGTPHNIVGEERAIVSSIHAIHIKTFNSLMDDPEVQWPHVIDWITHRANSESIQQSQQKVAAKESQSIMRKIRFYTISPGEFEIGIVRNHRTQNFPVKLTRSFEMMDSKVSQAQWAQIFGEIPTRDEDDREEEITVPFKIGDETLEISPDEAVTKINWWSALVFANELSRRHGLKPVYDLRNIKFDSWTTGGNGYLRPVTKTRKVKNKRGEWEKEYVYPKPKINAPNGNIYEAEGYRLPTVAEQMYLLSFIDHDPDKKIDREEFIRGEDFEIQGHLFVNLFKIQAEMSWDLPMEFYENEPDPIGERKDTKNTYHSLLMYNNRSLSDWYHPYSDYFHVGESGIGFRLVRTLPKN